MEKINIILANAAINSGNRGCGALSYTTLYLIDKVLSDALCEYNIILTDSGHKEFGMHAVSIANKEIHYNVIDYPIGINTRGHIKKLLLFPGSIKNLMYFKKADYILDIGQGDSFSDIYGEVRFKTNDRIHCIARILGIPYGLLPQTIGPFDNYRLREKACKSLAGARVVMARDKESLEYVRTIVPQQERVKEYIDVAFFLPYEKKNFDNTYIHVGLNISGLLWNGGYTGKNQFGLKDDYRVVIRDLIQYFLRKEQIVLHLVPHVVNHERTLENDYSVSCDIAKEYNLPNLIVSPYFFSPIEAKSYISGLDFFMGARMHSTIAAFSSGVPVIPMAYSRKFNGLFLDTLNYDNFVDLKTDDRNIILSKIDVSFNKRETIKNEILRCGTLLKERENLIIQDLKTFFNL